MATYTVKAPDGKTITLQGPDGASQADIIAQAQKLYQPQAAPPTNQYLEKYNSIRNSLIAGETDPQQRQIAQTRFDSDPRAQRLRQLAGLAPLSTAQGDVQAVARKTMKQRSADAGADVGKNATGFQSASAGVARGMFGIPEMLAAAGERFLPTHMYLPTFHGPMDVGSGNNTDASYSNILQMIRSKDTAAINANPAAGVGGEIGGSVVGGGAVGSAVKKIAGRAVASASPLVSKLGQAVENLGTLRKGEKVANAAKLVTIGAGAGGAQAAGEGSDIPTGIAEGAVAAPVIATAVSSIGKFLLRPAADILGLSNAGSYLKRFTNATTDQIQQKLTEFRVKTGAEPTLLELLPLADRNNLIKNTVAGRDPAIEQASNAIRERTANVQPEMQDVVQGATQGERLKTQRAMVQSLTDANGGVPVPGDNVLALRASRSPTDMLALRREESNRIMAPHDDAEVVPNANDLIPQYPVTDASGTVTMREANPEISRVIRAVSGGMSLRPTDTGVKVREVTDMVSRLREAAGEGNVVDRSAANAAATHLMDVLDQNVPEAAKATQQMRDAYAAHSRMAEGMGEGWQQRLRDEVQVGNSNSRAQGVTNAYDTDEGTAGRQLGTSNRLVSDLSRTPQGAANTTIDLARNGNPAIAENLGQNAGNKIQTAADAQAQSLEALASASRGAKNGDGTALNPNDITTALLAMGPHPFAKARILGKLASFSVLPPRKAKVVGDMLLSQDPTLTARAVKALGNERGGANILKSLAATVGQLTADATTPAATSPPPEQPAPAAVPTAPDAPPAADASAPDQPPAEASGSSPYSPALLSIYQNENPDLINLVQRVKHQESGGHQGAVSSKGAVGIMQVMPDTGPEAAKLAGVPWDEKAFHSDAAYNEILGIAYLSQLLRKYKGDVGQALAAYNAGTGKVDEATSNHGDKWLASMPAETQDYVSKVS